MIFKGVSGGSAEQESVFVEALVLCCLDFFNCFNTSVSVFSAVLILFWKPGFISSFERNFFLFHISIVHASAIFDDSTETIKLLFLGITLKNRPQFVACLLGV